MDASAIEAAQEDGCFAEVTVSRNLRLPIEDKGITMIPLYLGEQQP